MCIKLTKLVVHKHFCKGNGKYHFLVKPFLVQCPPPLVEYMAKIESFSKSGQQNKGQGVDFIHKEVNACITRENYSKHLDSGVA